MSEPDPIELLEMHRSTRGLSSQQIDQIGRCSEVLRVAEGEVVQSPGEESDALYLVIAGNLSMSLVLPDGSEKLILYLGRDDQVGLLAIIEAEPITTRLVAEHQSLLIRIPRDSAIELIRELPLWGRNLLRWLAPKVRETLMGKKHSHRPRFVLMIRSSDTPKDLTATLIEHLLSLGETVGLISDREDVTATRSTSLIDQNGQLISERRFRDYIGDWSGLDRVVTDGDAQLLAPHLAQLVANSDATYWFCSSASMQSTVSQLGPLVSASHGLQDKISLVRVLEPDQQVAPVCPELTDLCRRDFKLHKDGCQLIESIACTRKAGVERLVHSLRGVSIGLALGGGAARGMAHLGVLKVLEEAGITVDRMSGTSAGALTGILFAAGYPAEFCTDSFATDLKPGWPYRLVPYGDAFYALFKYRLGGWDRMLRGYLNDWRLEQLAVPFSSVAVDLVAAEPVIRRQGDAVHALLESINLPGIARPICRDGQALVDGGVLDVVPADVLANQGASFVISSDVSARIAFEFAGNKPGMSTEEMRRPTGRASLVRTRTVQDRNIRAIGGSAADIVIEPDVSSVELTDFKNAAKIANLGYQAAEEALPEVQRRLNAMDPQLFPLSPS